MNRVFSLYRAKGMGMRLYFEIYYSSDKSDLLARFSNIWYTAYVFLRTTSLEVHINKTWLADHRKPSSEDLPACKSKNQFFSNIPLFIPIQKEQIKNTDEAHNLPDVSDTSCGLWVSDETRRLEVFSNLISARPVGQSLATRVWEPKIRSFRRSRDIFASPDHSIHSLNARYPQTHIDYHSTKNW